MTSSPKKYISILAFQLSETLTQSEWFEQNKNGATDICESFPRSYPWGQTNDIFRCSNTVASNLLHVSSFFASFHHHFSRLPMLSASGLGGQTGRPPAF